MAGVYRASGLAHHRQRQRQGRQCIRRRRGSDGEVVEGAQRGRGSLPGHTQGLL